MHALRAQVGQIRTLSSRLTKAALAKMPSPKQKPQIVLFGDSLTEWGFNDWDRGFGWYLSEWYKGDVDVVNEGYAGYTSESTKPPFARLLTRLSDPTAPRTLFLTIFLGANDACFVGQDTYVPLPAFNANIRGFVSAILASPAPGLANTKIVLISCPPIDIPDPERDATPKLSAGGYDENLVRAKRGFRTYLSKKRFAEAVVRIGEEMGAEGGEGEGRVAVVDFWKACVDGGLAEQGRGDEVVGNREGQKYEEGRLPGCGLEDAKAFGEGWFTDGLHLGPLGYDCLSKALIEVVLGKWPELAPGQIEV